MIKQILKSALLVALFLQACGPFQPTEKDFYKLHSDWDILYVPIIEPYRAASTDGGTYWLINKNDHESIDVVKFNASKNFIYGNTRDGYSEGIESWFLFNVVNKLYAEYETEEQLRKSLEKFEVTYEPVKSCQEYFRILQDSGRCAWFPPPNTKYPIYKNIQPDSTVFINVTEDGHNNVSFSIDKIKKAETNVYFFKVKYNRKENRLLYIAINNQSPVLVKNGLELPIGTKDNSVDITLYTPYPVAQENGIPERDRIHVQKLVFIN